ncbi:hypothetical protein ACFWXA_30240 [Streptomyces atroolivaceus]|uniref:hypothetical protein n=1 Tax=Streptomyces atroolivaceus TaxID=66869 RepID=UPI00365828F1
MVSAVIEESVPHRLIGGREAQQDRLRHLLTLGRLRSRGGFTTRIHPACEQGQKALSLVITAGRRGDGPQLSRS